MGNSRDNSICFVIPNYVTFSTGGAEIQVHYLTQSFIKRNWKVEVVCAGIGSEEKIKSSPYYNKAITYHYYKKRTIRFLEYWDVFSLLKKTKSRVYYQRTDFALTAATYKYTKRYNKQMVYALALDSDAEKDKYITAFKQFQYSDLFKKLVRKVDFYILDRMIEWAKKRVSHIVFQNKYQAQTYLANFKRRGIIIPNSFLPGKSGVIDKENIVLWCGNDSPAKRPLLFMEIAKSFTAFKDWKFVMLGAACNQLEIKEKPDNVEIIGSVTYQEANDWFAKSKVYINTSEKEGMPNTFIQSWYYKTMVLSLAVDPNSCFTEEQVGFCCQEDLNHLVEKLELIIKNKVGNTNIENGLKYFKNHFDLDKNTDKLIEYINS